MKKLKLAIIVTLVASLALVAAGISMISVRQQGAPEEKDASYYLSRGDDYYRNGEYAVALVCYQKAREIQPENLDILWAKAKANNALTYTEDALACYEAAAAAAPDNEELHLEWFNLQMTAGYREKAKAGLESYLQNHSSEKLQTLYDQTHVSAPVPSLPSGIYDSYQVLTFENTSRNAAVYYTTDGSEPTSKSQVVGEKLILSHPSNCLKVKSINYLGYESETLTLDYEITVPVKEILRRDYSSGAYAIREALGKSYNQTIYNYEAAQLTSLYVVGDGWFTLGDGITFYTNRYQPENYLDSYNDRGSINMKVLEYTPFLETLVICWQDQVSLKEVSNLQYLKKLSLLNNNIRDISPLASCGNLEWLALGWNRITDLSALREMTGLTTLGLWNNQISDLSPIAGLTQLRQLDVANNRLESLDALSGMENLYELWINGNNISSVAALDPAGSLNTLMIAGNPIDDFAAWHEAHPNLTRTDFYH